MRLCSIILSLLSLLAVSCGGCGSSPVPDPGEAAVRYVHFLADGKYDDYIRAMVSCDSASAAYRNHMTVLHKQMVTAKKNEYGPMKSLRAIRSDIGNGGATAAVFLQIVYANDSTEDVMLPLVWHNDRWRLR